MLEVHEGEAPGEPMKTGMELVKEIREVRPHPQANMNAPFFKGFDAGLAHAAVLLQAWLREADNLVHESALSSGLSSGARLWIRLQLLGTLGTTRQEGKK